MQQNKDTIKAFLLGALFMLLLAMTTGGITTQSANVTEDTTILFRSVYASQDGSVVYVCDDDNVYRSTDSGTNWTIVLAKRDDNF